MAEPPSPAARITHRRLPLNFDAAGLKSDLIQLEAGGWIAHFNAGYHDGGWTGVGLRAVGGDAQALFPPADADYADTPLLAGCPHIRAALAELRCPVGAVRLLRLAAGGIIREHRDDRLGLADGSARLHIPVITNPEVEFYLDGTRVPMAEGECWYLDFSLPHRVQNLGTTDRVHLVVDCRADDWLRALIAAAAPPPPPAPRESSQDRFDRFRRRVFADTALQAELRREDDAARFIGLVVALGARHGFHFTTEDVRAAMQANKRAYGRRWMVG